MTNLQSSKMTLEDQLNREVTISQTMYKTQAHDRKVKMRTKIVCSEIITNAVLCSGAKAESDVPQCPGLTCSVGGGAKEPLTAGTPPLRAGKGERRTDQSGVCKRKSSNQNKTFSQDLSIKTNKLVEIAYVMFF